MVHVSEWLPNPAGADTAEWVELFNSGASPVDLSGWYLQTSSGRKTFLSGAIGSGEYRVLFRAQYKFVLRNTDESIALYDAGGREVDRTGFQGAAVPGKSYSRQPDGRFVLTDPTPGAPNRTAPALPLVNDPHPFGQPLSPTGISPGSLVLIAAVLGVFLAAVSLYILKADESLSHLFFAGDQETGRAPREKTFPF